MIIAIDKVDKNGNRIVTAEKLVWKGIQESKHITREHPRFKPEEKTREIDPLVSNENGTSLVEAHVSHEKVPKLPNHR